MLNGINKLRPWILGICLTAVLKLLVLQIQSQIHEDMKELISRAEYTSAWKYHTEWGASVIKGLDNRLDKLETLAAQTHDNAVALAKLQEDVTWIRESLVHYHGNASFKVPSDITAPTQ